MSAAGVLGEVYRDGRATGHCLLIGPRIPRIHHSDGIPVYLVVEHHHGIEISTAAGALTLLAYPSAWPSPGGMGDSWVYARHERMQWNAPIPLFDRSDA